MLLSYLKTIWRRLLLCGYFSRRFFFLWCGYQIVSARLQETIDYVRFCHKIVACK